MNAEVERDLTNYEAKYQLLPFEATQVRFRRRATLELIAHHAHRRILEIGCGLEPIFLHLHSFEECTVVEPADMFYANALAASRDRPSINVLHGSLEAVLPKLRTESYDLILLSSVLHEVADPSTMLRAIATLCAADTLVHIVVPNAHSFHRLLALEMGLIGDVYERSTTQIAMQQATTFSTASLSELVLQCGFTIVDHGTFFVKPFAHAQMAHCSDTGVLSERLLEGLYRMTKHFPAHGSEIYMNIRLPG